MTVKGIHERFSTGWTAGLYLHSSYVTAHLPTLQTVQVGRNHNGDWSVQADTGIRDLASEILELAANLIAPDGLEEQPVVGWCELGVALPEDVPKAAEQVALAALICRKVHSAFESKEGTRFPWNDAYALKAAHQLHQRIYHGAVPPKFVWVGYAPGLRRPVFRPWADLDGYEPSGERSSPGPIFSPTPTRPNTSAGAGGTAAISSSCRACP